MSVIQSPATPDAESVLERSALDVDITLSNLRDVMANR